LPFESTFDIGHSQVAWKKHLSSARAKNTEIPWLGIFRKACMPYQIEMNSKSDTPFLYEKISRSQWGVTFFDSFSSSLSTCLLDLSFSSILSTPLSTQGWAFLSFNVLRKRHHQQHSYNLSLIFLKDLTIWCFLLKSIWYCILPRVSSPEAKSFTISIAIRVIEYLGNLAKRWKET
jgi:hypothetical protein